MKQYAVKDFDLQTSQTKISCFWIVYDRAVTKIEFKQVQATHGHKLDKEVHSASDDTDEMSSRKLNICSERTAKNLAPRERITTNNCFIIIGITIPIFLLSKIG